MISGGDINIKALEMFGCLSGLLNGRPGLGTGDTASDSFQNGACVGGSFIVGDSDLEVGGLLRLQRGQVEPKDEAENSESTGMLGIGSLYAAYNYIVGNFSVGAGLSLDV